ncbi:MAG: peroxidase [Candidatus Marinimicrobia bacterium]|jgi:alkylhydroperoxidase family enzyme|nr:peroxidase [Candidatus Neomarinimicrobiota bacterium]MBT5225098.1 peroxidase [Candidatus Neomarinimicrobiota bacterium]MBT7118321.1 peroxidase [Candidatus Neomarinimicrobiota bacterium]MBT7519496.1 peroxidase [Candidatus Neomarinimicrobiota bacterium]
MAWIDTINERDANGSLKDQYAKLKDSRSGVDNILKIHSLNPESLDAHVRLYKTIMYGKSPIRRVNREMIAVLVSSINQCHY